MFAAIERFLNAVVRITAGVQGRARAGRKVTRFATLIVVLAVLMLLPLRPSPGTALIVSISVLAAGLAVAIWTATTLRSLFEQLVKIDGGTITLLGGRVKLEVPLLHGQVKVFEGSMRLIRRAGIALPALVFFIFWALVYMLIWSRSPAACPADPAVACGGAFWGAGTEPSFGDFLYLSVNMAFANPVPDLIARSQITKTVATIEVLTGIGLATLYASSFFGLRDEGEVARESAPPGS